ncbi:hypothetical protein B4U79_17418 [Dinothrombium tinctorium]|uniref:N-acetyltransferase domain-containing protein n=1 Tax=Dinothrombium tinctorium TaxID=1965070 RepID=A0A3S3PD17_9ACAR|nr:hypothetical protein B4U79_17418 [Dinothrombium tinctorium]
MSSNLVFRVMQNEDVEEVIRLFSECFAHREPIGKYFGISVDTIEPRFTRPVTLECAKELLSFVCEDTSLPKGERIVGFRLCSSFKDEFELLKAKFDSISVDENHEAIKYLMNKLKHEWLCNDHPDLANDPSKMKKILSLFALGVKSTHANLGIATKLLTVSLNHAKSLGYELAFVIATAEISQHIFSKKLGFKQTFVLPYKDAEFEGRKFLAGIEKPPHLIVFEKFL